MTILHKTPALFVLALLVSSCGNDDKKPQADASITDTQISDTNQSDADTLPDVKVDVALDTLLPDADGEDSDEHDSAPDGQEAAPDGQELDVQADSSEPCEKVTSVSGKVVDDNDEPIVKASATLCVHTPGQLSHCESPVSSASDGTFKILLKDPDHCISGAAYQLLLSQDLTMSSLYCVVDLQSGGDLKTHGVDRLVKAPDCTRDPYTKNTDPHKVEASNGTYITVIPDSVAGVIGDEFTYEDIRLLVWANTKWDWPCFIDPTDAPEGLIAFAPELEIVMGAVDSLHIAFANDKNLKPGTVVDVMVLGGGATKTHDGKMIKEGHWEKSTEAIVDANGKYIVTPKGKGLMAGTWVGWRLKK